MNHPYDRLLKASIALSVLLGASFGVLAPASAQSATAQESGGAKDPGTPKASSAPKDFVIDDWSHHHLVFSNPANLPGDIREKIVKEPRYQMQQRRRSMGQRPVIAAPDFASSAISTESNLPTPISAAPKKKEDLKKDWSVSLGGVAATLTGVVGTPSSSSISGTSKLTVDSVALSASAPTAATATGTFAGNPTNGQTVTIGGSEVLTPSLSTAAVGSITVASSFCFVPGQNVSINGTALTTNATAGTGTFVVTTVPSAGETVAIGGVTYTFETTLSGTTPINQVQVPTSDSTSNRKVAAQNLSVAINNTGTCGSGTPCTRNVSAANPQVSSTNTGNTNTETMTSLCADNATITGTSDGSKVTVNTVTAGGAGSNTTTTFALNTSGATPASQTQTAANIITTVNTNTTTKALVTASSSTTGVVTLTANTWGSAGNSLTVTDTATSGVTESAFSGGTDGTNTGTSFAIDNVNADAATNLAAAIGRSGGTVGVGATSSGAVVTVTATTPGTSGNSITLAETLSNFGWTPAASLGGGTDGTNSSTTFAYWSGNTYLTSAQVATNIANAINANTTLQASSGVGAVANAPASGDVTITANAIGTGGNSVAVAPTAFSAWTPTTSTDLTGGKASAAGGKVQPNAFPAKFSFDTSVASCASDFVVYPTGATGATGTATIAAYNNIYTGGCTGLVPSVFWTYNTGNGYAVTTSPIISNDDTGSQIAFIQSNGTTASLVILKWAQSTSGNLTSQASGAGYQSCTAPCMYSIPFGNLKDDTLSAPFYDYHGDVIYVGDDSGNIHQFTGVFNGAPAEATSPWPVPVGANILASPVYDPTWNGGQVYVGDLGGVIHCVTPAGAACVHGGSTTPATNGQIADAPLVDGSANYLLFFVNTNSSNTVYGYGEQFFPTVPGSVGLGTGATNDYLYAGTFDNLYYQSLNHTGNMYVVGSTGSTAGALYQVGLVDNGGGGTALNGAVTAVVTSLTSALPWPSPVTEFCNPGSNSDCAIQTASATGCTVKTTSRTLTCTAGNFTSADVGLTITGTDIAAGTTVTGFTSPTSITMSVDGAAATTTGTAAISQTSIGTDYIFFSVNRTGKGSCSTNSGNGCVLSYNVSIPSSVAVSGSGLPETTPGTNGCWATGGLIIDNAVQSGTLAGASEIYFVALGGNNAGGPNGPTSAGCTTVSTATITGVQTSQANPN